ncbi:BNR repeat-containing protein [Streptomyces sp. NPDC049590]|uniref:BNR repeat-containing protein n=1 Tax=Streptomyces sp. NPDC049590 TaxID=3154834 RepID=UPI003449721F
MRPSLTGPAVTRLDARALYFVSHDGPVNTNSFQKHGLLTHGGHQYAVWYTASREAVVARRRPGAATWPAVTLPHRLKADDSHNVICMGVSPADGRLHLNLDSHSDGFHRVTSVAGLLSDPSGTAWGPSAFGAVRTTLDGLPLTDRFTCPQFLTTPEGRLQLGYRAGVSGNGRNARAEYGGSRWTAPGEWSGATGTYTTPHGTGTARSMYLHGLDYDRRARLHALFTRRERDPAVLARRGGLTNHDTGYVYSDDRGRTWHDGTGTKAGTTGGTGRVRVTDAGLTVDPLGPDHCLMNQESQCVDSAGSPHPIISHLPVRLGPATTGHPAARTARARAHHVRKTASGAWLKTEIPVPLRSSQRTRLVLDRHDNAYAVLPHGRITAASAASKYTDWALLSDGAGLYAFGEVVVDETRSAADGVLPFMYQERSAGTIPSPLHVADFAPPA